MRVTLRSGFPIRKSTDQSLLAAPHGLSQRVTSFIASQRQGIHQMPLETLDQTVRKGKCRRYEYQAFTTRRSYKHILQDCSHPTGRPCSDVTMQSHGLGCLSLTLSNSVPGGRTRSGMEIWFISRSIPERLLQAECQQRVLVGTGRFELPTSRLSVVRSNQLSYAPVATPCRAGIERKRFARWRPHEVPTPCFSLERR